MVARRVQGEAFKGEAMKRTPRMMIHYRGAVIFRNARPDFHLRWSALGFGASDTLDGMKDLIRNRTVTP